MTTSAQDISFVLSGGSGNLEPNLSLGGQPSAQPLVDNALNNLFDDVVSEETEEGHEDYRCIYVFNDGDTVVYNPAVYIFDDFESGSFLELGVESRNEVQRITISGDIVDGGSMTLSYESKEIVSEYNSNLGIWATTLESQLNSLTNGTFKMLTDVTVTAQNAGADVIIFDINFNVRDGKRNHDTISIVSNDITPEVSIDVTTPQQGAPVNAVAPTINIETTPPGGVGFFVPTEQSPITVSYLKPGEGIPIWVKRLTETGTVAVENDGFVIRFRAESLEPLD